MDICGSIPLHIFFSPLPYLGLLLEFILKCKERKKIEKESKTNKADGLSNQKQKTFPKTE